MAGWPHAGVADPQPHLVWMNVLAHQARQVITAW
jgi:hypothetical protein